MSISKKGKPPFVWICLELFEDEKLRALSPDEWTAAFMGAFRGEKTALSKYIKLQRKCPGHDTGIEIGRPPDVVV